MSDTKRRAANPLPLKRGGEEIRHVKLEAVQLREKLQKAVIDNPQTAKKAAILITMWIEGKTRAQSRANKKAA
jgi:hypothetical protein